MDWIVDPGLRTESLTQSFRIHFVPSGRAPGFLFFVCLWFLCSYPTRSLGKG